MWSRHSSLIDRTNRSAYALALGACGGVRTTRIPAPSKTSRTDADHCRSRSSDQQAMTAQPSVIRGRERAPNLAHEDLMRMGRHAHTKHRPPGRNLRRVRGRQCDGGCGAFRVSFLQSSFGKDSMNRNQCEKRGSETGPRRLRGKAQLNQHEAGGHVGAWLNLKRDPDVCAPSIRMCSPTLETIRIGSCPWLARRDASPRS
jgi:hypothetical protein